MGSRKDKKGGGVIRGTLANIGRVIAALIMVGIITGCIIASVLTVYILRYINSDEEISLSDLNLRYSTILYTEETDPETGEPKVLQQLQTTENRIWVSLDKIPKHMQEAVVAIDAPAWLEEFLRLLEEIQCEPCVYAMGRRVTC